MTFSMSLDQLYTPPLQSHAHIHPTPTSPHTPHPTQTLQSVLSFKSENNLHVRTKLIFSSNYKRIKGALDNISLILRFCSKKVEIFIPLKVYTYVVTACLILLASST